MVARKPYPKQTLRSAPYNDADRYQTTYIEVLICTYKQSDDDCFYLWDTFNLNLSEFYEH